MSAHLLELPFLYMYSPILMDDDDDDDDDAQILVKMYSISIKQNWETLRKQAHILLMPIRILAKSHPQTKVESNLETYIKNITITVS